MGLLHQRARNWSNADVAQARNNSTYTSGMVSLSLSLSHVYDLISGNCREMLILQLAVHGEWTKREDAGQGGSGTSGTLSGPGDVKEDGENSLHWKTGYFQKPHGGPRTEKMMESTSPASPPCRCKCRDDKTHSYGILAYRLNVHNTVKALLSTFYSSIHDFLCVYYISGTTELMEQ